MFIKMLFPVWSSNESSKEALPENRLHIWRARLHITAATALQAKKFLSDDEIKKADRFSFEQDAFSFIAARGILRVLLSRYFSLPARDFTFAYEKNGKPFLKNMQIQFNLSHSGGLALYAFHCFEQIGIDVEKIRPIKEMKAIGERYFSRQERELLDSAEYSAGTFFQIWTRREAVLKAEGGGIASETRVNFEKWKTLSFAPDTGYAAALAVKKSASFFKNADFENNPEHFIRFLSLTDANAFLWRAA